MRPTHSIPRLAPLALLAGCLASDGPVPDSGAPIEILYRGVPTLASYDDGHLVVEGDILVTDADLAPPPDEELGRRQQASTRRIGAAHKWSGTVNYSVMLLSPAARLVAQAAVEQWRGAGANLVFNDVTATGGCAGDCIAFVHGSGNRSPVGRQGGMQELHLQQSGVTVPVAAHELGHALGFWHEQSRPDRDAWVMIDWSHVRGCRDDATSPSLCGPLACELGPDSPAMNAFTNGCCTLPEFGSDDCYKAHNYALHNGDGGATYAYDYDSIMHYPPNAFGKTTATGAAVVLTPAPGKVFPSGIGSAPAPSDADRASLRALYPTFELSDTVYRGTGEQELVRLIGRQEDANSTFSCSLVGASGTTVNFGRTLDTTILPAGDHGLSCSVGGSLWSRDYPYPAAVPSGSGVAGELWQATNRPLRVLDGGLVAQPFALL